MITKTITIKRELKADEGNNTLKTNSFLCCSFCPPSVYSSAFLLPLSVYFGSPFNHVGTLMAPKKQQILKHFTHLIFQGRHIAYIYMSLLCCDEKFVPKFVPWISCAKLHLLLLWKSRKYSKVTIVITMQRHHRHHHSIFFTIISKYDKNIES